MASRAQCTFTWDSATDKWEPQTVCNDGFTCAQNPTDLGIVGNDGDVWISPCVAHARDDDDDDNGKAKHSKKRSSAPSNYQTKRAK